MAEIKHKYLMVSMDLQPDGFSIQAWIGLEKPNRIDLVSYPHMYTYMGASCTWFIYSSSELTPKIIVMAGEQADRICIAGEKQAKERKIVNL